MEEMLATQEQLSVPYMTYRDVGNAGNAGCSCQYLYMRRSCASLRPRHTVHPVH